VVRGEARRQLREQIAVEMNAMNASADDWTRIEPLLDDAMHALDETDRTAILLRFFENKSLREVGQTLGTTDDTARKRVNRAIERLREFFAKRGITTGASGIIAVISANAVQAAPVGLVLTISTAVVLAGTSIVTTTTAAVGKAIAMTALQKTLVGAFLAVAVGTAIYQARQTAAIRDQVSDLEQQKTTLTEQMARHRDEATLQLSAARSSNLAELARLRGEVTRLQREAQGFARLDVIAAPKPNQLRVVTAIIVTNLTPQTITEDQIRANIQTRTGDAYSRLAIDRDVRGLYGMGLFSNIRVIEESNDMGMVLTYVVKEKTQAAEAAQPDFRAGTMRFISADAIRMVLPFYAELTGLELDLHPEAASSPAKITLENDRDMARSEAINFIERILREQAGLVIEYSTPGHAAVSFDKSVMTNATGRAAR
jgi:hypothetical protein